MTPGTTSRIPFRPERDASVTLSPLIDRPPLTIHQGRRHENVWPSDLEIGSVLAADLTIWASTFSEASRRLDADEIEQHLRRRFYWETGWGLAVRLRIQLPPRWKLVATGPFSRGPSLVVPFEGHTFFTAY
jgi:hypothetical protein